MMRRLLIICLGLAWFIGAASAQQVLIPGCTGNCSFGNVSVTGTTVPTNGLFLPAANTLGFATNSAQVAEFDSAGRLLIGTTVNHLSEPLQVNGAAYVSGQLQIGSLATLLMNGALNMNGNSVRGASQYDLNGNQFLSSFAAATLHLGAADANPPVAQTLGMQGATGTNIAGADATIAGSQGTGTGAGGSIVFQTAPAGASGAVQNALVTALKIDANLHTNVTGTTPTMGACGTAPSVVGNDQAMAVTVGTGGTATSCTVNFGKNFTNAPVCNAQSGVDVGLTSTSTVSSVTVQKSAAFTAASGIRIVCVGYL